jgi:hypothetical protein
MKGLRSPRTLAASLVVLALLGACRATSVETAEKSSDVDRLPSATQTEVAT